MKTRLLGLAVLLVALGVIVNTLALSSASVTNSFTLPVVNTSAALIALDAADVQDSDMTASTATGQLVLTVATGVQPHSTYTFNGAFKITNNSTDAVEVTVTTSGEPANVTLSFADNVDAAITGYALASTASVNVKMTITTGAAALDPGASIDIVVSAVKP